MSTPHNSAAKEQIAKSVLMPGDPLRAKFIAETFLDEPVLVNPVRGINGYTGSYKGVPVTVMASGMGMPSIGIYSYELYNHYGVEKIIRVGSAGSIDPALKLRSVVAAMSAYTDSAYGSQFAFGGMLAPCADFDLLRQAWDAAEKMGVRMRVGPILSSDRFYTVNNVNAVLEKLHVLCVEMETFALYLNAAQAGKKALSLLTISDDTHTGESVPPVEIQTTFTQMMEIALELA